MPNRELANTLYPLTVYTFNTSSSSPMAQIPSNINMDININIPRERLAFLSINSSRESSTYSAVLSVSYHKRIKIQNINPL